MRVDFVFLFGLLLAQAGPADAWVLQVPQTPSRPDAQDSIASFQAATANALSGMSMILAALGVAEAKHVPLSEIAPEFEQAVSLLLGASEQYRTLSSGPLSQIDLDWDALSRTDPAFRSDIDEVAARDRGIPSNAAEFARAFSAITSGLAERVRMLVEIQDFSPTQPENIQARLLLRGIARDISDFMLVGNASSAAISAAN